jgi:GNAT superfamily N-acetyltransferase
LTVATDADVQEVVSLVNRAFRGVGGEAGWSTEEKYIEGTRITEDILREDMIAKSAATLLIWRQSCGDLLGCVWMEPEQNGVWYVGTLTIDPREQKAGLGRKLLQDAEHWAQHRGAKQIKMSVVNVRAALIEWYKRRGYLLTKEKKPFPYGDNRYGTPKRDDLHFVVLQKALIDPNRHRPA